MQQIIAPSDSLVQFCLQHWWWNTLLCWKGRGQVPPLSSPLFPEVTLETLVPGKHCWSVQIGWRCSCRCNPQLFDAEWFVPLLRGKEMLKIKWWGSANNIVWGPRSDLAFNILNQNRQNQIFPVPLYFYKESIIILCMRSLGTLWAPTSSWRPFRPAWFCPSRPPDPCITVLDIANFFRSY